MRSALPSSHPPQRKCTMNGYALLSLLALSILPALAYAGCAESQKCCEGKDNYCYVKGQRMNGSNKTTCFCDETCIRQGDCCTDFQDTCRAVDCVLGEWGDFGECSVKCGKGHKIARREALVEPKFGGKACALRSKKIACWGENCKVARHSSSHHEAREIGKIIPAQFGSWRKNKMFDPFKDIRRNLFNHYSANTVIRRPSYCAKFELTDVKSGCGMSAHNPWASKLKPGESVCIECQPIAMKRKLGVRCKGHGVFMRQTRWNAVTVPGCSGKWIMKTRHEECTCNVRSHSAFILI